MREWTLRKPAYNKIGYIMLNKCDALGKHKCTENWLRLFECVEGVQICMLSMLNFLFSQDYFYVYLRVLDFCCSRCTSILLFIFQTLWTFYFRMFFLPLFKVIDFFLLPVLIMLKTHCSFILPHLNLHHVFKIFVFSYIICFYADHICIRASGIWIRIILKLELSFVISIISNTGYSWMIKKVRYIVETKGK